MKKFIAFSLLLSAGFTSHAQDPILFKVNDTPVTQAMMQHMASNMIKPGVQLNEEIQQFLASEITNRMLLSQAAVSAGLDQKPEHKAGLELERISYLANLMLQEKTASFEASDEVVQALYDKEYSQPKREFKARHILLKDETKARDLIGELQKGADFAELAKQHSTGPTGPNGGDLGWFTADSMVEPFAHAVAAMEKGRFSDQPVQTPFGWHLILLEDSRDLPAKPLQQVKTELVAELRQQALQNYLKELRSNATFTSGN